MMRAIELFAGAGGLGMGVSAVGFEHAAVVEWNRDACATLRENQARKVRPVFKWPDIYEGDVRAFDFSKLGTIDLVAGGPPCQPFSLGGKHQAHRDRRDMWPQAVRAVRELRPRAFLFENVRGLTRQTFAEYFEHIRLQLAFPEFERRAFEEWPEHRERLLRHAAEKPRDGLRYDVFFKVLNASDFGVPQRRERVFVVGFRSDLGIRWAFPTPTHSHEALLWTQRHDGEYWDRHGVSRRARKALINWTEPLLPPSSACSPWRTVRDALSGLPEPKDRDAPGVLNHRLQPGAKPYTGHTGSALDEPAKTLKAGVHGVPGGENMLAYPDGRVRYFSVRESARLQTFPDDYAFRGAWGEAMRQIGNAVPVRLARTVAMAVKKAITSADTSHPTHSHELRVGPTPARGPQNRSCSTPACSG